MLNFVVRMRLLFDVAIMYGGGESVRALTKENDFYDFANSKLMSIVIEVAREKRLHV